MIIFLNIGDDIYLDDFLNRNVSLGMNTFWARVGGMAAPQIFFLVSMTTGMTVYYRVDSSSISILIEEGFCMNFIYLLDLTIISQFFQYFIFHH